MDGVFDVLREHQIAIVLTACGIETAMMQPHNINTIVAIIAIVLTACGIETTTAGSLSATVSKLQ